MKRSAIISNQHGMLITSKVSEPLKTEEMPKNLKASLNYRLVPSLTHKIKIFVSIYYLFIKTLFMLVHKNSFR